MVKKFHQYQRNEPLTSIHYIHNKRHDIKNIGSDRFKITTVSKNRIYPGHDFCWTLILFPFYSLPTDERYKLVEASGFTERSTELNQSNYQLIPFSDILRITTPHLAMCKIEASNGTAHWMLVCISKLQCGIQQYVDNL
jgi:hypothetical protein